MTLDGLDQVGVGMNGFLAAGGEDLELHLREFGANDEGKACS